VSLRFWLPEGGNWEGGETDPLGRQWYHEPNVGWRIVEKRWTFTSEPRQRWWSRWLQK
jgi:hypothetical protein